MPILTNTDSLGFWGRYLIYAQEPFGFPIGLIRNLSFPFQTANITRGSMPLFGLLFKLLSKLYPPFAEFYYFPLVEIISVFLAGYFTCRLLENFKVKSFWLKLLGSTLVALSFPLLFRSSSYFEATIHVLFFPLYLAFIHFYIQLHKYLKWQSFFSIIIVLLIAALTGYYITLGIAFMFCVFLSFNFFALILKNNKINRNRLVYALFAFILGICLSFLAFFVFGNQENIELSPDASPLIGRYNKQWGYGGGFGGGFHVADVLTYFIPPKDSQIPNQWNKCGPTTYLTKLGYPISMNDLQDGQYEGFAYLGTTTIGILIFLIITNLLSLFNNFKLYFIKLKLKLSSKFFTFNPHFSLALVIGTASFMLYILSWGYIIHFAGVRFNNIPTPSLIIAVLWPKFMFVRSLGRLAIPFMLFITIGMIVYLNKYLHLYIYKAGFRKKALVASIIILLIIIHISEVRRYLKPPQVVYGNEIANVFGEKDKRLISQLLNDKKALMIVPQLQGKLNWGKISYALAFHAKIPISGATIGSPGERAVHLKQYSLDIEDIVAGNIKEIVARYGKVAIAAPSEIAEKILINSNLPLENYKLNDQDVVILILDENEEAL